MTETTPDADLQARCRELEAEVNRLKEEQRGSQIEISVYKQRLQEKDQEVSNLSITATKLNLDLQETQKQLQSLFVQHINPAPEPAEPTPKTTKGRLRTGTRAAPPKPKAKE